MSVKEENEITVKVTCSNDELIKHLTNKGFNEGRKFTLDDYYLIPKDLDIENLTTREILAKAIIIRYIVDDGKIIQKITFKKKNINKKGEILSQKATNCYILDFRAGINLFNELGYYEIMNIKESDVIYYKDKIELALKFIENSNTLIEIETNDNFDTIDKLKKLVNEIEIPIEKDTYFVKKAEDELNKISEDLLNINGIASVSVISSLMSSISDMLGTLNYVVLILVIASALLDFVVLYNLANINIGERQREIATLKVLGFYNKEVDNYINKENLIFTIVGIILGLVFGYFLTDGVVASVEIDKLKFIRHVVPISYVYSAIITAIFSVIVNKVIHFVLKKIDMIESLKSVE